MTTEYMNLIGTNWLIPVIVWEELGSSSYTFPSEGYEFVIINKFQEEDY